MEPVVFHSRSKLPHMCTYKTCEKVILWPYIAHFCIVINCVCLMFFSVMLLQDMIHIADTKVARRYGDFFIRQIHKFEEVSSVSLCLWARNGKVQNFGVAIYFEASV